MNAQNYGHWISVKERPFFHQTTYPVLVNTVYTYIKFLVIKKKIIIKLPKNLEFDILGLKILKKLELKKIACKVTKN